MVHSSLTPNLFYFKSNGVKHIRSVPSSNGAVERFIQTFKKAITAGGQEATFHQRLMNFLLVYQMTPHTTGVAPSVLFLRQDLRTRLHLLHPDVSEHVKSQQATQKAYHDQVEHSRERDLWVGQRVLVRNYRPGEDWIPVTVVDRKGSRSCTVQVANGQLWHRHIEQLKEMRHSPQEDVLKNSSDNLMKLVQQQQG